jgi:formylglycine-generating enzyme required for sulfatase activity
MLARFQICLILLFLIPVANAQDFYTPGDAFTDCEDCPTMVVVPKGFFMMGSPEDEQGRGDDEGPQHFVTIPNNFAVGKFEVTKGQFATFVAVTGYNAGDSCYSFENKTWDLRKGKNWRDPGFNQFDSHPVVCISWDDTQAYISWLNNKTGKAYRLLTEAEWEYAARAGTTSPRYWSASPANQCTYAYGSDETAKQNSPTLTTISCNDGASHTSTIGAYAPNDFGLYDLIGNAWEWTEDCRSKTYHGAPTDGSAWLWGNCGRRVMRGGSWNYDPTILRSANRGGDSANFRYYSFGFRLAMTLI